MHKISAIALGLASLGLVVDNWRVGKKYEKIKTANEKLILQNQTYDFIVKGLLNPKVSAKEYSEGLKERLTFLAIVTGDDYTPKED